MTGERGLKVYIAALWAALLAVLFFMVRDGVPWMSDLVPWAILVLLWAGTELADLRFSDQGASYGLSAAEAIYFPMVVLFSADQTIIGAVIAISLVRAIRFRTGAIKAFFNVAQYGCAAAIGTFVWKTLAVDTPDVDAATLLAGTAATLAFALSTHLFTSVVFSLLERRSLRRSLATVGAATAVNLVGNLAMGSLFASSMVAEPWTATVFPVPLAGLYVGYRAVLRQKWEGERIEKLHEATRALASSPKLDEAVVAFMEAVRRMVSARRVVLMVGMGDKVFLSEVAEGDTPRVMSEDVPEAMLDFAQHLRRSAEPVIVLEQESSPWRNWAEDLGATSMVATPLDDDHLGCLFAIDREGAGEFTRDDGRLLDALAHELVLSLGSYRLFAQVSEERERFGRIFLGSREGICLVDDEGRVLAWNPRLELITGYSAEEVIGEVLTDKLLILSDDKRRLGLWDLVGSPSDAQLELLTKEGPSRWISMLTGSVATGQEESWVILVRDVTAQHEAEQSKSDFLSTISHELRTPLTSIKGSLQILAREPADLPEGVHSQMVGVLQRSSDRLERLLLNLLFVSRVETEGELRVASERVDLEDLIRAAVDSSLPTRRDDVKLVVDPTADLEVIGEREGLAQMIGHLLDNAGKFSPEGEILVTVRNADRKLILGVSDRGPGIARVDQERIFDRFVRLGDPLTRETQGPGIGLFIVRSVAEAHGGRVWVESNLGEGSTFYVELPLARRLQVAPPSATQVS